MNWSDQTKRGQDFTRIAGLAHKNPGFRFDGSGRSFQSESVARHVEGRKQPGLAGVRDNGKGDRWFQDGAAANGSRSNARKAASARIAKIPLALSRHIARVYRPMPQKETQHDRSPYHAPLR